MIILANLMNAVAMILGMIIWLYVYLIIGRAIISWVNADPYNPIVRFLTSATEPLLKPLRRILPFNRGGMDFTPIILMLILYFLNAFLVQSLSDYAMQLKGPIGYR